MPCTSHHSLHCWKLPSRIRTPLSTCLDATVDIVEIDEGTEVKARTDGRRTRIGGTEVPGPGPRGRVAHERIVPLGRVVVEHSIGDGVTVIGAATHRYDPFAVVETLHAGRGAADQFTGNCLYNLHRSNREELRIRQRYQLHPDSFCACCPRRNWCSQMRQDSSKSLNQVIEG